jgi:hypothetical protein
LTLDITWFGERTQYRALDPHWKKWPPTGTSPHWYTDPTFERFVAVQIAKDADQGSDRTMRTFLTQFCGLRATGKHKSILESLGLLRTNLSALRNGDDVSLDRERTALLLAAMKRKSKPVKPVQLGLIGKANLAARFEALDADMETFIYRKFEGVTGDIPWVVEGAFVVCDKEERRTIQGINWSAAIGNPFRKLGRTGESLDSILEHQYAGSSEPLLIVVHLAQPGAQFADRGKSQLILDGDGADDPRDGDDEEEEEEEQEVEDDDAK